MSKACYSSARANPDGRGGGGSGAERWQSRGHWHGLACVGTALSQAQVQISWQAQRFPSENLLGDHIVLAQLPCANVIFVNLALFGAGSMERSKRLAQLNKNSLQEQRTLSTSFLFNLPGWPRSVSSRMARTSLQRLHRSQHRATTLERENRAAIFSPTCKNVADI